LYYTFFAYPSNDGVLEKQETFLDLDYFFEETLSNQGKPAFSFQQLGKGEGDGSSFPSGGLRVTHKARAYTVWDPRSEVFLRNRTKVLYIPSLLVTHYGEAMDDKTLFRKS
jgi:glutamine synthetase